MSSRIELRRRFWVEVALAGLATFLFVLTLITREWIEEIFHVDPDGGDGSLEWMIVAACALVAIVFSIAARLEWRRAAGAQA